MSDVTAQLSHRRPRGAMAQLFQLRFKGSRSRRRRTMHQYLLDESPGKHQASRRRQARTGWATVPSTRPPTPPKAVDSCSETATRSELCLHFSTVTHGADCTREVASLELPHVGELNVLSARRCFALEASSGGLDETRATTNLTVTLRGATYKAALRIEAATASRTPAAAHMSQLILTERRCAWPH